MSYSKCASAALSPVHPPLGTLIDGHSLELVEVLGVGGYGIVYRAVDRDPLSLTGHLKSYAVKCLVSSPNASPRQRHVHIREIALHQLASVHPGVVTLHRVIEHQNVTYIILDYAPDHDLFTQILRNCRYLGNDDLIKHVFLQLLDAVEYCHLLGIYHRDLKPENVLCFDGGIRVAITDFGLATTEKMSDEFRTGSVYHMSPECQGGEFAPDGYYSPQANDVWSLGIVLLNLATGRNPWKSAMASDPTFQAYLRNPRAFLPSVLPISYAANELLMRMLDVNWHTRMTLPEVRRAIKAVDTFYCDGVIFEGSMARCPWEAGMDLDSEEDEIINDADELVVNEWRKRAGVYSVDESSSSSSSGSEDYGEQDSSAIPESLAGIPPQSTKSALAPVTDSSRWSADSATSQIVFANRSPISSMGAPWTDFTSSKATWGCESNISPTSPTGQSTYGYSTDVEFQFDAVDSDNHRFLSIEETEYNHSTFQHDVSLPKKRPGLKLNTHLDALEEYTGSSLDGTSMASLSSASSDTMQTANDYEDDSSSSIYFLADSSAIHSSKSPRISITVPLSNASSTYEDPLSFMHTSDHIAQLLTPSKDTLMTSPLATNADWHVKPLTRASFSGEDTPSRYSVSSAAISPLLSQMLSEEDHDKDKLSSMASRASSWNTVFGAASMRTGGMKSPYNTFCRSTAPSPEESVLKMTLQGSTDGIEVTEPEQLACESLPQIHPALQYPEDDSNLNGLLMASLQDRKSGNATPGHLRVPNRHVRLRSSMPCGSCRDLAHPRCKRRHVAHIQAIHERRRKPLVRHLKFCRPIKLQSLGNTAPSDVYSRPNDLPSEQGQRPFPSHEMQGINSYPDFILGEPPFISDPCFVNQVKNQHLYLPPSHRPPRLPPPQQTHHRYLRPGQQPRLPLRHYRHLRRLPPHAQLPQPASPLQRYWTRLPVPQATHPNYQYFQ